MTKPKHTPEPWPGIEPTHCRTRRIPVADYLRAIDCVNACAGLEDPERALNAVRGFISFALTNHNCDPEECFDGLQTALQLLTPKPFQN